MRALLPNTMRRLAVVAALALAALGPATALAQAAKKSSGVPATVPGSHVFTGDVHVTGTINSNNGFGNSLATGGASQGLSFSGSTTTLVCGDNGVCLINLQDNSGHTFAGFGSNGITTLGGTSAQVRAGSGTPEGAITAAIGSLFLRTDGSASTSLYVKESGASSTGWVAYGAGGNGYGAYSGRPAAGTSGRTYIASDAPVSTWVDDGSAWRPLLGGQAVGSQPKAASSFTVFNQVGSQASLVDRNGALHFAWPNASVTTTLRGYYEALSSTTAHVEAVETITSAQIEPNSSAGFPGMGIMMMESSSGKIFTVGLTEYIGNFGGGVIVDCGRWTSATSRAAGTEYVLSNYNSPVFLKLVRDATNIYAETSKDGTNWTIIQTTALTTAFTTAPDRVGIYGQQWDASDNISFDVLHYYSGT